MTAHNFVSVSRLYLAASASFAMNVACLGPGEPPPPFEVPPVPWAHLHQTELSPYESLQVRMTTQDVVRPDIEVWVADALMPTERYDVEQYDADSLIIPRSPWPVGPGLIRIVRPQGEEPNVVDLEFEVLALHQAPGARILVPGVDGSGPSNLSVLLVESTTALWPTDHEPMLLTSDGRAAPGRRLVARGALALIEFESPARSTTVAVSFSDSWQDPSRSGAVQTSSVPDEILPEIVDAYVDRLGPVPELWVQVSEPCTVIASVSYLDGTVSDVPLTAVTSGTGRILLPETEAVVGGEVNFYVVDVAGHQSARHSRRFAAPEMLQIRLQELVTTPIRDWGDSNPNGRPFDAHPGDGTVGENDEWIELVNTSTKVVSLMDAGLEVRITGRTVSTTAVASAPSLYFGSGGNALAWQAGEALVVRLRGRMSQRDVGIEVWWGPRRLDQVWIGEGGQHPGGGPPTVLHESLDRGEDGRWRWCEPSPGEPNPGRRCR